MSNGYPMAAVLGRENVMQAAQKTFISSTYWTEGVGPAAALATIRKHASLEVAKHLVAIGERIQAGWKRAAAHADVPLEIRGIKPLSHFTISGDSGQAATTLFTQTMLERGFLATQSFYATFAHTEQHVFDYLTAVKEVFTVISKALAAGSIQEMLKGPMAQKHFACLTPGT